jgi:predicted RNA binding protein with dsRBD fold (UPF0201 family)
MHYGLCLSWRVWLTCTDHKTNTTSTFHAFAVQGCGRSVAIGSDKNCAKMHCVDGCAYVHLPFHTKEPPLGHISEAPHPISSFPGRLTKKTRAITSNECPDVGRKCAHADAQANRSKGTKVQVAASDAPCSHPDSSMKMHTVKRSHASLDSIPEVLTEHRIDNTVAASSTEQATNENVAIELQKSLASLGHHIEHCSSTAQDLLNTFTELRQKMKVAREFLDPSNIPKELLDGSAVGLKSVLARGLVGHRVWTDKGKVADVKLLLAYDNKILLSQLGMHTHVSDLLPS